MDIPPSVQYAERDGASIAFQAFGAGELDVVVISDPPSHLDLIWTDSGYVDVMLGLADRRRVVTYDRRGTGLSDPLAEQPTLESQALDLEAVMDRAEVKQAVLFGYGSSTVIATYFAATRPQMISRLVLFLPWSREWEADPNWQPAERDAAARKLAAALDNWGEGLILDFAAPALVSPRNRRLLGMLERASNSRALARSMFEVAIRTDISGLLPHVQSPALVIHHEDGPIPRAVVAAAADLIPDSTLAEVGYRGEPRAMADFWLPVVEEINHWLVPEREAQAFSKTVSSLLFTDLGSTEHAERVGDAEWRATLVRHDNILRDLIDQEGGRLVKSIGDGSLSVFDGPVQAVRCALLARDAIAPLGLRLRAGVHTGECERIGLDLAGVAVHVAARAEGAAAPGEVLVTRDSMALCRGSGLAFESRGSFELKGLSGRWELLAARLGEPSPVAASDDGGLRVGDRAVLVAARRVPGLLRSLSRRKS